MGYVKNNTGKVMKCKYCGERIYPDEEYYVVQSGGLLLNALASAQAGKVVGDEFCSEGCAMQYYEAKGQPMPSSQSRKQEKAEKRAHKREMAKEDSDRSLALLKKLCMFGGFVGVHAFYAGKILHGLLYLFFIAFSIGNKMFQPLLLNVGLWALDLLMVLGKRFTDHDGRTIRK